MAVVELEVLFSERHLAVGHGCSAVTHHQWSTAGHIHPGKERRDVCATRETFAHPPGGLEMALPRLGMVWRLSAPNSREVKSREGRVAS
jgi:hypothetical protein